ncbi:MAG TPA: anthranilate synthase component I family protein [Gaiellaceae bacterium]|nr:anthranilate synthase component I family protein [Gaiellaceae bacterium]
MLELWEPEGALEALEEWLGGLRKGESADVYLGYRLADELRREPWPSPPEPCPLPVVAARVRASDSLLRAPFRIGGWEATWAPEDYAAAIDEVRAAIARGDVYQVNLVQHLSAEFDGDPHGLAAALADLRPLHPRPIGGTGWTVVSGSPELFLARRGDRLWTKPIKGTRPIGEDIEDVKDAAEHVMIVDLERNDLSRVCEVGSIRWPELMVQQELAGVTHLVSTVEGTLRPGVGLAEILRATFPGGSITGAPKISAVDHIARLEPVGRGASMGAVGTVHANGDFELALTIRTFAVAEGRIHLWAGGGIVWDSEPDAEIEESWVKARPLLARVGGGGVGLTEPPRSVGAGLAGAEAGSVRA